MIYGELGQTELKFSIWQRMTSHWKKDTTNSQKLPDMMLKWLNIINYESKWLQGVKTHTDKVRSTNY